MALAEYDNEKQAKAAIKNLAYHKFNYLMPLYLEFAPLSISRDHTNSKTKKEKKEEQEKKDAEVVVEVDEDPSKKQERTLFVKNLNFSTTEEMLE